MLKYYEENYEQILPGLYGLFAILIPLLFIENYKYLKSQYGPFLVILLLFIFILIIDSRIKKTRYKKLQNHWWQIKIDPFYFRIFDYISDRPSMEIFTWTQQQGPKDYGYRSYIRDDVKHQVKIGDKIVVWIHGETIGVYALGEVIKEPWIGKINVEQMKHYRPDKYLDKNSIQLKIKILYNLFHRPISNDYCYERDLAAYADYLFSGLRKLRLPDRFNRYPREPPDSRTWSTDWVPYKLGRLDTYSWVPIKPIREDIWDNLLKVIESGEWY